MSQLNPENVHAFPSQELRIETAHLSQLEEITDFMQPVYANTYPNGTTIKREMFENDTFRRHLREYLEEKLKDPSQLLLLARDGQKVVGTVGLSFDPDTSTSAEMWGFYVSPDLQGHGIGTKLYDAIMEQDRATQLGSLHLNVAKSSLPAIKFYEAHGFAIKGEEEWDWPSWVDQPPKNYYWIMEKDL